MLALDPLKWSLRVLPKAATQLQDLHARNSITVDHQKCPNTTKVLYPLLSSKLHNPRQVFPYLSTKAPRDPYLRIKGLFR